MVFPWFSQGFPMKHPATSEVSPPSSTPLWRLAPAPRCWPWCNAWSAKAASAAKRPKKWAQVVGWRWNLEIFSYDYYYYYYFCYYYCYLLLLLFFFLLIKAKLSGWGSVLMAQKWWILGYWCCLQHATWIRLPSFSLATRLILLDQGDPVDTFFVDLLPLQAAKSTECSHHLRVEYQPDACSRDVRIWLLLIVFVIINTTTITLLEFPHLLFHLKTWVCLVSAGFSSFSICSGHKLWVSWYAPFSDTRWPVAAGWSMAQWKQLAQLEFLASRPW